VDETLADILPHRPPMVMIDALVRAEGDLATAVKTFDRESYGAEGGRVLESALIECLAQTVAALEGRNARQSGRRVPGGILAGVDHFVFHRRARCDCPLQLTVTVTRRIGPFCLASGRVEQDGAVLAEGNLKFYLMEENGGTEQTPAAPG